MKNGGSTLYFVAQSLFVTEKRPADIALWLRFFLDLFHGTLEGIVLRKEIEGISIKHYLWESKKQWLY
jgi:hypothetical protein